MIVLSLNSYWSHGIQGPKVCTFVSSHHILRYFSHICDGTGCAIGLKTFYLQCTAGFPRHIHIEGFLNILDETQIYTRPTFLRSFWGTGPLYRAVGLKLTINCSMQPNEKGFVKHPCLYKFSPFIDPVMLTSIYSLYACSFSAFKKPIIVLVRT